MKTALYLYIGGDTYFSLVQPLYMREHASINVGWFALALYKPNEETDRLFAPKISIERRGSLQVTCMHIKSSYSCDGLLGL